MLIALLLFTIFAFSSVAADPLPVTVPNFPKHGVPFHEGMHVFTWHDTSAINDNIKAVNANIMDALQLDKIIEFDKRDAKWNLVKGKRDWDCERQKRAQAEINCKIWRITVQSLVFWLRILSVQNERAIEAQLKNAFVKLQNTPREIGAVGFNEDYLYVELAKAIKALSDEIRQVTGVEVDQMEGTGNAVRPYVLKQYETFWGVGQCLGTLEMLQIVSDEQPNLAKNAFLALPWIYLGNESAMAKTLAQRGIDRRRP